MSNPEDTQTSKALVCAMFSVGYLVFFWYAVALLLVKVPNSLMGECPLLISYLPALFFLAGVLGAYESILYLPAIQNSARRFAVTAILSLLLFCGIALLLLGCLIFHQHLPSLASVGSLLIGYALGIGALISLSHTTRFGRKTFAVCFCSSMAAGAILFSLGLDLNPENTLIMFLVLAILVQLLFVANAKQVAPLKEGYQRIRLREARDRMALNRRTGWYLALYGCVIGLKCISMLLLPHENLAMTIHASAFGFVLGAGFSMLVLLKNPGNMLFNKGQRLIFPLLVVGLIPWEHINSLLIPLAYLCVFAGCAVFIAFCRDTHCFFSEEYHLLPLYPLAIGSRCFVRGLLGGVAVFGIATAAGSPFSTAIVISSVLMVVLALVVAFVEEEPDRTQNQLSPSLESSASRKTGLWKQCCLDMAGESGLTPREADILQLLLKAYTVERIGLALCISSHTAKTHVYRIYRKMSISSRNELSDAFEQRLGNLKQSPPE